MQTQINTEGRIQPPTERRVETPDVDTGQALEERQVDKNAAEAHPSEDCQMVTMTWRSLKVGRALLKKVLMRKMDYIAQGGYPDHERMADDQDGHYGHDGLNAL